MVSHEVVIKVNYYWAVAYMPMWLPVQCIAQACMGCERRMPEETAVKASGQIMTQVTIMKHSPQIAAQITADKLGFACQEKEAKTIQQYATIIRHAATECAHKLARRLLAKTDANLRTRPAASVPYLLKERRCRAGLLGWRCTPAEASAL